MGMQALSHGVAEDGSPRREPGASAHCPRSAGFQTCRIADFQIGNALQRHLNYSRFADLEICDTADWEVGATEGRCADAPTRALAINSHSPIPSSFCLGTGLVTSASTFQFAGGGPK